MPLPSQVGEGSSLELSVSLRFQHQFVTARTRHTMTLTASPEISSHFLSRLETGFRTDSARLCVLEKDLSVALLRARQFGEQHGPPLDWNSSWRVQWDDLEARLRRIRGLVAEMDGSIACAENICLTRGLEAWETLRAEDEKLLEVLAAIRNQAVGLNLDVHKDWNMLAHTLEQHLQIIQSCADACRIKLELLRAHTFEEVNALIQNFLLRLPDRGRLLGARPETIREEYARAAAQLGLERHKFMGFMDVVKGLLMWVESTDERVQRNRTLSVEQA